MNIVLVPITPPNINNMSLKLADMVSYVSRNLSASYDLNKYQLYDLFNEALDKLSIRTGEWTNQDVLTGLNTVSLPADLRVISKALWNDVELLKLTVEEMMYYYPYWRTDTGAEPVSYMTDGTNLILNCTVTSGPVGILKLYGSATLGHFSEDETDPNPLEYIPLAWQNAPAFYALAELPGDIKDPNTQFRMERYAAKWKEAYENIEFAAVTRRSVPFGFL